VLLRLRRQAGGALDVAVGVSQQAGERLQAQRLGELLRAQDAGAGRSGIAAPQRNVDEVPQTHGDSTEVAAVLHADEGATEDGLSVFEATLIVVDVSEAHQRLIDDEGDLAHVVASGDVVVAAREHEELLIGRGGALEVALARAAQRAGAQRVKAGRAGRVRSLLDEAGPHRALVVAAGLRQHAGALRHRAQATGIVVGDAGMIEGVAVALAWAERDGLTPHEWARAMLALGIAPTIDDTRGLAFLLAPAGRAYTISGSFYRYLLDHHGAEVVRRAYRTGDLAAAAGRPVAELAREWRRFLETVPITEEALALARLRFARGAIFARPCPHRVAQLHRRLGADLGAGDTTRAIATCREVLALDPADTGTRAVLAASLARAGATRDADRELDTLARRWGAPTPLLAATREAIADAAWRRGDLDAARAALDALANEPRTEDAQRVFEVKQLALRAGGREAELLGRLLAAETPPDGAWAVHLARSLEEVRADGLPAYLEARQLASARHRENAAALLSRALTRGLPTRLLTREAERLLATSLWAAGKHAQSAQRWAAIAARDELSEAARVEARDWLVRARLTPR